MHGEPAFSLRGFFAPALAFLLCALTASTSQATPAYQMLTISVSSAEGTGSWSAWAPPGTTDWSTTTAFNITSGSNVLATVQSLGVSLDFDPVATVTFGVIAGAVPTNFTISSALVAFPALINPIGTASASVTVTDQSGTGGASLTGQYAGPLSYQAQYNAGANIFGTLLSPATVLPAFPHGSNTQTGSIPNTVIPGAVTSIQGIFSFTLSANDLASGTGRFSVTPEPSTFVLLAMGALGGLGILRRRR